MRRVRVAAELTSLIGRDALLESVARLLQDGTRLITLVGSGGVGKTRLARELIGQVDTRYDATALVHLADLDVSAAFSDLQRSIFNMIAEAMNVIDHNDRHPLEVLVEHLHQRRVLLVLDNCEHLEAVGDVIAMMLEDAPTLCVVATSRSNLRVWGEHVVTVPPVTIPEEGATREQALGSEAVKLLLDRAKAAGRPITERDDWGVIVELTRQSGGLPLFLELLAAQLGGGLAPAVILERYGGGMLLRAPENTLRLPRRHMSLDVMIEVSWGLCGPEQQRLWARLGVFLGGFDLEAAETVCGGGEIDTDSVMHLLSGLVRQSLVTATLEGRYYLLPHLREYGLRCLREFGELDEFRERQCEWMRHVAKVAAERWFSADERAWLARIYGEFPNLRAAVAWCGATGHSEVGLDIITDVMAVRMPFFYALETQMCGWLEDLLALGPAEPTPARIQSVAMLGWTRIVLGDQDLGKVHRDECQSLARQLNAEKAPPVLFLEGSYQVFSLADRAGLDLLVAARDGFRAAGAHGNAHMAALLLAMGAGLLGPSHLADQYSDECLADALAHKAKWAISWAQWTQGLPARTHPQDVLRNVLPVQIALGDRWGSTWTVESETWRRAAAGQFDSAALLLGGSISLQRRHGVRIGGLIPFARQRAKAIHRIIAEIGEDAYRTAYDKGSALTTDEVYELALRRPSDAEPAHRVPAASEHALSPRQRHVAQLIGKGYSNKKIAAEMNLSTRTVETHLRAIYSQLQLNRTQLAARAREQHQTSPD